MAKWSDIIAAQKVAQDLPAARAQAQDARNEVLKLRQVNAAQADNFARIAGQLSDREHQLRQAQERIRAAEMQRDMLEKAHAQMQQTLDRLERERDRAWNDAIKAAAAWCDFRALALDEAKAQARNEEGAVNTTLIYTSRTMREASAAIRALAKLEAGE